MNSPVREQKAALRARIREALRRLSPAERADASARICSRLRREGVWQNARTVLLFSALADEPNLASLIDDALASGKVLALPRYDERSGVYVPCEVRNPAADLSPGRFGITEPGRQCPPIPVNRLDFVAVPGVAFGPNGCRLGRGKGYYDRMLASIRGCKCGIGFDQQWVEEFPTEPHDVFLDCVMTPTHWCRVDRGAVLK